MSFKSRRRRLLEEWQKEDFNVGFAAGVTDTIKYFREMSDEDLEKFRNQLDTSDSSV